MPRLRAPFPWFGGKSRAAHLVWPRFGDVGHYIEPFAGSLAVLFGRPHAPRIETINDKDCHIANFWRAVQVDPEAVAQHADWPVNEADLYARHQWLIDYGTALVEKIQEDPLYFEPKVAGWWVWGLCQWIGDGFCYNHHRKRPNLHNYGKGIHQKDADPRAWFQDIQERLRKVRVCCGDWTRVVSTGVILYEKYSHGIFLDPPYCAPRSLGIYRHDSQNISGAVRQWAAEHGTNANIRIALCGFEGEHNTLETLGWTKVVWDGNTGYANSRKATREKANRKNERIWFSPHCLQTKVPPIQKAVALEGPGV